MATPTPALPCPYDTHHAQPVNTVEVNQQLNRGQWNALATFTFDARSADYVEVSDRNEPYAIADAGKLQYVGPPTD